MSWNYRVIRTEDEGGPCYAIHEVHYEDGRPTTWTENPVPVSSESVAALFWVLGAMVDAAGSQVLEIKDGTLIQVGEQMA